jgi:hypothetical protein
MTDNITIQDSLEEITFPSRGRLYDGKLPNGKAHVRAWRTSEIKLLVQARKGNAEKLEKALDRVVDNCLVLPDGLGHGDLLFTDGFFALVAQRIFTYSPNFKSEFKCRDCGWKNTVWIDLLADLNERVIENSIEPIVVDLPQLNIPIGLRLLRRKDAKEVTRYSKSKLSKTPGLAELGDPGYSYRIALQIVTIDGEKPNLGQKVTWVDSLHAQDLMAIENALEDSSSGIDPVVTKTCESCGEDSEFILPMNMEFFRPRSSKPPGHPQDAE